MSDKSILVITVENCIENKADHVAWREENRKKQAAGVKFEAVWSDGTWRPHFGEFTESEEDYREVPQPHAAERALWKAQREAGTNEVWQGLNTTNAGNGWFDLCNCLDPVWEEHMRYRVKPIKLTARIARYGLHLGEIKAYDWEFTGTREEYRAECEKYGYVILSEIKEVKPKTVRYYFAFVFAGAGTIPFACSSLPLECKEDFVKKWTKAGYTIIGDIEEREIEV